MIQSRSTVKEATVSSLRIDSHGWEYAFGPYRLDPSREMLTCRGKVVALPSRLFALLHALMMADGNVVSRKELSLLIWPDGNVGEGNLSQHIYMLRHVLGESRHERQFIMTVHGKGFRFAAPVTLVAAARPLSKTLAANEPAPDFVDENAFQAGYEAFVSYTRASALMERPDSAALSAAIACLNSALAIDSGFVPALIAVARAYTFLAQNSYAAADWAFPRALDAIERAFLRAPSSASVHAVKAKLALLARWDWQAAKDSIDTAMSLNSAAPLVRSSAAWLYAYAGDHALAWAELQEALLVEPHSPGLELLLGRLLVMGGEYERAIEHLSRLLEGDQRFDLARQYRAEAYVLAGRPEDAIVDLLFIQRDPTEDAASRLPLLCRAYARAGDRQRATDAYECLVAASGSGFVTHSNLAMCSLGLERFEEALDHLDRALAAHEPPTLLLHGSPWFAPLKIRGRFERMLRALNATGYPTLIGR